MFPTTTVCYTKVHFNQNLNKQNTEFIQFAYVDDNRIIYSCWLFFLTASKCWQYIYNLSHENWDTSSSFLKACKQK